MDVVQLLEQYDHCHLECDGLTSVLHYVLNQNKISHSVYLGTVLDHKNEEGFAPHYWIVLGDGRYVDFRARMWLGNHPYIANGVFKPEEFPDTGYQGKKVNLTVNDRLFQILMLDC